MNSLSTCNQNHTAISWDHNDSVACPMCALIESHSDETDRLAIQFQKMEEQRDEAYADYEDADRRADSLERYNSALEDDIANLESEIKDLQSELEALK